MGHSILIPDMNIISYILFRLLTNCISYNFLQNTYVYQYIHVIPKTLSLFVNYFLIPRYSVSAVVQTKASFTRNNKLEWVMCAVMETDCDLSISVMFWYHDDVINWKHLLRYWPFVRGIHRPPVNSTHKGQWRRALMFSSFGVGSKMVD